MFYTHLLCSIIKPSTPITKNGKARSQSPNLPIYTINLNLAIYLGIFSFDEFRVYLTRVHLCVTELIVQDEDPVMSTINHWHI